jgi:imidazolonepropionase-like amidohydrolase
MMGLRMIGLAAALAVAGAANAQDEAPRPPAPVLYLHAGLIDGTGSGVQPDMAVLVEGERIKAVGPSAALAAANPSARKVDVTGRWLVPGLINSHVHLATPPDRKFAEALLRRDIYGGVTAVRDMADDLRAVAELQRASLTGEIPAPDIYYAALMAGPEFFSDPRTAQSAIGGVPGHVPWMQAITPDTDLKLAVAMARGTGATAIKIYADLEPALVAAIIAEAHRQGIAVWTHAMVFPTTPREGIEAGADVISHSCMLAYEASAVKPRAYHNRAVVDEAKFSAGDDPAVEQDLAEMKRRGTILDATNYVYVTIERMRAEAKPGEHKPWTYCSSGLAERITGWAHKAGVEVSTGTDSPSPPTDLYPAVQGEMELLVDKSGFTPLQAIRSATLVGAMSMGKQAEMGTIAPGKLADLVFVSADPSRDIRALRKVTLVVKRGKAYPRSAYRPMQPDEYKGMED